MMTSRTYPTYTDAQILSLCTCVTLGDLISRGVDRKDMTLRELEQAACRYPGAVILEWEKTIIACVLCTEPITIKDLVPGEIIGAHRRRVFDGELFYHLD
jgi:hypothetical protein